MWAVRSLAALRPRSRMDLIRDIASGNVPIGQLAVMLVILAWFAMMATILVIAYTRSLKRRRVRNNGIRAMARVQGLTPLGWRHSDQPGARLSLFVMPPDGPGYAVSVDAAIPELFIPRVQPGCEIPVSIDPNNRSFVVLDLYRG